MEPKKISFGFSKITKKADFKVAIPKTVQKVDLIDCLEGQSIKVKDAIIENKGPLVIPLPSSKNNIIERAKEAKLKREELELEDSVKPDSELSIDELAARELIREAKQRTDSKLEIKVSSLTINPDKFVAEGAAGSTIDDYDNVPISDYGMAMLRGMGWKEGMPIGRTRAGTVAPVEPEIRPKGLGLGANKLVKTSKLQSTDKDGKEIQLVKGAYGKIIAGGHRGVYCQVEGLDDDNCRIIVKTALTNEILSLNEFLIVPVTKEEYTVGIKVINNAKYEDYKEGQSRSRSRERTKYEDYKEERTRSKSRSRERTKSKKNKKHKSEKKKKSKSRRSSSGDSDREYHKHRDRSRR